MSAGPIAIVLLAPAIVVIVALSWRMTRSRGWQERELMKLAQRRNLAVPDHLEEELLRHIVRRRRAWMLGYGVGYLLVFVPAALLLPRAGSDLGPLMLVLAFAVGTVVTTAVTLVDRRRTVFGEARVARLDGPAVDDLIAPATVRLVGIAIAAAIAAAAVVVVMSRSVDSAATVGFFPPLIVTLAVVAVAALVLWRLTARHVAAQRPISGDATTLAWSDALRAESIGDMLLVPTMSAALALQLAVPTIAALLAPQQLEAFTTGNVVGLAIALSLIIAMTVQTTGGPGARHYQRRLWPELAAATTPGPAPDPAEGRA